MGAGADNTAALCYGGESPSGNDSRCESWNGSAWTEVGDLNAAKRDGAGVGTVYTSCLAAGGYVTAVVATNERWNGSSWTEVNNLNTARRLLTGTGAVNTQAIAVSGWLQPGQSTNVETWNGTNWTETTDVNVGRYSGS